MHNANRGWPRKPPTGARGKVRDTFKQILSLNLTCDRMHAASPGSQERVGGRKEALYIIIQWNIGKVKEYSPMIYNKETDKHKCIMDTANSHAY